MDLPTIGKYIGSTFKLDDNTILALCVNDFLV